MVRDVSDHFSYHFHSGVISLRKCGAARIGLMQGRVNATPFRYERFVSYPVSCKRNLKSWRSSCTKGYCVSGKVGGTAFFLHSDTYLKSEKKSLNQNALDPFSFLVTSIVFFDFPMGYFYKHLVIF